MIANYLSFEAFKSAKANALQATVGRQGIRVHGRTYNHRKLRRFIGQPVRYFLDESGSETSAVVLILDGEYLCNAEPKRRYNDELWTFVRALTLNKRALRKLYANGPIGWRGIPWHIHLADVAMNVLTERPPLGLPWGATAKGAAK